MDAKYMNYAGFICHLLRAGDSGQEGGNVIMHLHGNSMTWSCLPMLGAVRRKLTEEVEVPRN